MASKFIMICLACYGGSLTLFAGYFYYSINDRRVTRARDLICDHRSLDAASLHNIQHCFNQAMRAYSLREGSIELLMVRGIEKLPCSAPGHACAAGHGYFGKKVVVYSLSFLERDQRNLDYCTFVFKHEIAHIQNGDALKLPLYNLAVGLLPLIFAIVNLICPWIAMGISAGAMVIFVCGYSRFIERRADHEAVDMSSREEREAIPFTDSASGYARSLATQPLHREPIVL